jgi:DNA-binding transcriptional ArsR family regulator
MKKVSKDTPLMELTLRRYERPDKMDTRDLIKKFCLSMGLLQPGDSRDIIVDILYVLLRAKTDQRILTSEQINLEVKRLREDHKLAQFGVAPSNVRRQIKRLRDLLLVEKVRNNYRITEFAGLSNNYKEKFEQYLLPSVVGRINEYFREIDRVFGHN